MQNDAGPVAENAKSDKGVCCTYYRLCLNQDTTCCKYLVRPYALANITLFDWYRMLFPEHTKLTYTTIPARDLSSAQAISLQPKPLLNSQRKNNSAQKHKCTEKSIKRGNQVGHKTQINTDCYTRTQSLD